MTSLQTIRVEFISLAGMIRFLESKIDDQEAQDQLEVIYEKLNEARLMLSEINADVC
jgi:hypothetical protein